MRVLQLPADYFHTPLYKLLFEAEQKLGIENEVYVTCLDDSVELSDGIQCTKHKFNALQRLIYFGKQRTLWNELDVWLQSNKIDLIHAHTLYSTGYLAYKAKQRYGIPYVVAVRNTDINVFYKRMPHLRYIGAKILRDADAVVFISNSYSKFVHSKFSFLTDNQCHIIPNGVNKFWLEHMPTAPKICTKNRIRLIFAGLVGYNKNILLTIQACKLIKSQGYDVEYTIIGKIEAPKYKTMIDDNSFITYHPFMSKELLIEQYRKADIFVMPSFTETFGLVYVEAMSQGLPVIYTRGQGFDGAYPEGEVGYSVNPNDANELVDVILKIIENYASISTNCIKATDKYNWNDIAFRYKGLYDTIKASLQT